MKHDRSVIDAAGGPWLGVADRLRAEVVEIMAAPAEHDRERRARIVRRMRERGIRGVHLARRMGLSPRSVTAVLSGRVPRSEAWWERLERALGK